MQRHPAFELFLTTDVPTMRHCPKCSGHKQVACDECDGAGEKKVAGHDGDTKFQSCNECGGAGWVDCPRCSESDGRPGGSRDLDQMRRGDSMF